MNFRKNTIFYIFVFTVFVFILLGSVRYIRILEESHFREYQKKGSYAANAISQFQDLEFLSMLSSKDYETDIYRELQNTIINVQEIFSISKTVLYSEDGEFILSSSDPEFEPRYLERPQEVIISKDSVSVKVMFETSPGFNPVFIFDFSSDLYSSIQRMRIFSIIYFFVLVTFFVLYTFYLVQQLKKYIEIEETMILNKRLTAFGILGFKIAHNAKNSLQVSKLLLNKGGENLGEDKEKLARELENISVNINEILDFSNLKSMNIEKLDLKELLNMAFDKKKDRFDEKGLRVKGYISKCCIYGDRKLLSLAVENILDNAIMYSPQDSEIVIDLSQKGRSTKMLFSNPSMIPFSKRTGEAFYTTNPSGRGLGVFLTKNLVKIHHGYVKLYNKKGRFTVEILIKKR